jgi:putative NADH-flavin reductase
LLTDALVKRGHTVVAFVHNTQLAASKNLICISGDIHNQDDVTKAVENSDVVVSTLGSWGSKTKDIVGTATKHIVPAMEKAHVRRFISVTGGAASLPSQQLTLTENITHTLLGLVAKPILVDAEIHLALLSQSKLNWTAVRSPVMTNGKSTHYRLELKAPAPWARVTRHAVVGALVELIEKDEFIKQAPFISS